MTAIQEEDVLAHSVELVERLSGRVPRGYVAPWWEVSAVTTELLRKYGVAYDRSQAYRDFVSFDAPTLDKGRLLENGQRMDETIGAPQEIDLVELGANWYVDDLPPMLFMKASPNSQGFVSPHVLRNSGVTSSIGCTANATMPYPSTPMFSGWPQVLLMLKRLINYIGGHAGVPRATMEEVAADIRGRFPCHDKEPPRDY